MGEMIFEKLDDMLELLKENKDLIFFLTDREYRDKGVQIDVELRTVTEVANERFLLRYVENVFFADLIYKEDVDKIMVNVEKKKKEIEKKMKEKGFYVIRGDVI